MTHACVDVERKQPQGKAPNASMREAGETRHTGLLRDTGKEVLGFLL